MPPRKAPDAFIVPMAAQAVTKLPEGSEWLYELKLDGYRALLVKDGSLVRLISRRANDLTRAYPSIEAAGAKLKAKAVMLDGEIVAVDAAGRPDFQALQNRDTTGATIVFFAFDVLRLDGRDLTAQPLEKRRARLPAIVDKSGLLISQELPGAAADVVAAVRGMQLERVVAKRRDSIYEPGERSGAWVKLKLDRQQEFVVGGFRPNARTVDALLVVYYVGKELKFAAKVRAGFVPRTRSQLYKQLLPLTEEEWPFADLPSGRSRWGGGVTADEMDDMTWTRPELVVQLRFVEWTGEGRLRHAFYLGLRDDKAAQEVVGEI